MKHIYNLKRQTEDARDFKLAVSPAAELPRRADLREGCPPVFDQGGLGSCTANAGVAAYMMLKGTTDELSRLFLYYEERRLEGTTGQDAGATMRSIGKALSKAGVCREPLWPYLEHKYCEDPPKPAGYDAAGRRAAAYRRLSGFEDMKQYIAVRRQPVMAGIEVYESFESAAAARTGVVPLPDTGKERLLGGHAVLLVGYDDDFGKTGEADGFWAGLLDRFTVARRTGGSFIARNSWGEAWGDGGYCYLPYAYLQKHGFDFWVLE